MWGAGTGDIMIDTVLLIPPGFGPTANPLLFGVSEGLARLFPLPGDQSFATSQGPHESSLDPHQDSASAPLSSSAEA